MDPNDIRQHEDAIWNRLLDGYAQSFWVQTFLKVVCAVVGTAVASIGGGMNGDLFADGWFTLKGGMVVGGAAVGAIAGIVLILSDRDKPSMIADTRADLAALRVHLLKHTEMEERERWRADCEAASQIMFNAVESALLATSGSIESRMNGVLNVAHRQLLRALGIPEDEDWTISVFRRDDAEQAMVRVAERWSLQVEALIDKRKWAKGQGFTGQSWAHRHVLAETDAQSVRAKERYSRPPEMTFGVGNPHGVRPDDDRYRSFACIPIVVGGGGGEPWGILTVTSDVTGRFDYFDTATRGGENMPILKVTAAFLALVATCSP